MKEEEKETEEKGCEGTERERGNRSEFPSHEQGAALPGFCQVVAWAVCRGDPWESPLQSVELD